MTLVMLRSICIILLMALIVNVMVQNFHNAGAVNDRPSGHYISVVAKQKCKLVLFAIKNIGMQSLYELKIKISDVNMQFIKARGWESRYLDGQTILETDTRPIDVGSSLVVVVLMDTFPSNNIWRVEDLSGKLMQGRCTTKDSNETKPAQVHAYVLTVTVVDTETKSPVADASVFISDRSGRITAAKTTDRNGVMELIITAGQYRITIQAMGFYEVMDELTVQTDTQKTFELVDR